MAVLDLVKGIEVTVHVDGQSLKEYDADNDDIKGKDHAVAKHLKLRTVTKYIESLVDKEFAINVSAKSYCNLGCPWLCCYVEVDGKLIDHPGACKPKDLEERIQGHRFNISGKSFLQPLTFKDIVATSEDNPTSTAVALQKNVMKQIGEIKVGIYRLGEAIGTKASDFSRLRESNKSMEMQCPTEVHERSLKGECKDHGVQLGTARPVPPLRKCSENLKALHVVPRTPRPEIEPSSRVTESEDIGVALDAQAPNLDNLDEEEKVQVQLLLQRLRSGSSQPHTPERGIKRENGGDSSGGPRKKAKLYKEKVSIDLTGDEPVELEQELAYY